MLLAGSFALAPSGLIPLIGVALIASMIADWVWYWSGKLFGYRVLAGLCKLSINPLSCVSQTDARFLRWGLSSLVVAKFIPGFSTVAPPIAGALRMSRPKFLLAAASGAALWAGAVLGVGWLLQDTVQSAISVLEKHAATAVTLTLALFVCWLGWKFWQKFRFRKFSELAFVSPDELIAAMDMEGAPLLLDLRSTTMVTEMGEVPGATRAEHDSLDKAVGAWPKELAIVTMCSCPLARCWRHVACRRRATFPCVLSRGL